MFAFPQTVLRQLLSAKLNTPERLSHQEREITDRICHCVLCDMLWIRRKTNIPDRCPKCHKRAWDRPLLSAMLAAAVNTQNAPGEKKP
jgi:predicted Zn-ribbon and HTH transcriptional regulator